MDSIEANHSAEPVPDHDFHSAWGSTYSARSTLQDPQTKALWSEYLTTPSSVERKYHVLLNAYTRSFADFFGGFWPISLHAHATDALLPTTIASLVLNTVATSPLILASEDLRPRADEAPEDTGARIRDFCLSLLGWTDTHVHAPTFVTVEGIYGAGFGPLAHTSKEWEIQAIAAGACPAVVNLKSHPSFEELDTQFAAAKAKGAIGVVFDMVSTEDGSVLSVDQYMQLKYAAQRNRLLIIVDETMTAIRCGAPFAFQRTEYNGPPGAAADVLLQPDLVVFGKGMGISGVAIGFAGVLTRTFAYTQVEDILQTILYWRALVSRPVRIPVLIEALGVLRLAQAENWPARSETVGQVIRNIVFELEPSTREPGAVRGLGAMIALDREVAMKFGIQSAVRRRSPWIRWLPKLDRSSADRELLLRNVFTKDSAKHRKALAREAEAVGTMPLWCFICGIQATEDTWCRQCYLGICGNEVCQAVFAKHICIGR